MTVLPPAKFAAQVEPQSIPAGELVTEPLPPFETLNVAGTVRRVLRLGFAPSPPDA